MSEDIRDPDYLKRHPVAMAAFQFVCGLTPENFLRFTRMCIEYREAVDQRAIADASKHFRSMKPEE
jgi:hypothetical protein